MVEFSTSHCGLALFLPFRVSFKIYLRFVEAAFCVGQIWGLLNEREEA